MPIDYSHFRSKKYRLEQLTVWDQEIVNRGSLSLEIEPTGDGVMGITNVKVYENFHDRELVKRIVQIASKNIGREVEDELVAIVHTFLHKLEHFSTLPNFPPIKLSLHINCNGYTSLHYRHWLLARFVDVDLYSKVSDTAKTIVEQSRERLQKLSE